METSRAGRLLGSCPRSTLQCGTTDSALHSALQCGTLQGQRVCPHGAAGDIMFGRRDYEPKNSKTPRQPEGLVNFEAGMRVVKF
jgi:hypothetical protein